MIEFEIAIGDNHSIGVVSLSPDAHWQWLANGWLDFKATWRYGLVIGGVPVVAAWVILALLWRADMLGFLPAVCGGFALVGPLLAIGCYEISRKRSLNETITLQTILRPRIVSRGQVAIIGFVLLLLLIVWARLATMLFALATSARQPAASIDFMSFVLQTPEGIAMLVTGSVIGGILASIGYLISVVSIPLASDQAVDAMTAMLVSIVAVARNRGAMISFAFNIAVLVAISLATGFIALIFIFPWLGHATWHCYDAVTKRS